MDLRERIGEATKDAMRARAAERLSVLRLMSSAIKDRDILARGEGLPSPVADDAIVAVLARMVKQRGESAKAYDDASRPDLAGKERAEVVVIEEFLPRQLSDDEMAAAIDAAIAAEGATSLRDMGRVMTALRARHVGAMDFGRAGALIKARLG